MYLEYNIVMKSGVCLTSETGASDCVTIDAQGQGRVIYCNGVANTTKIEGLTITGGYSLHGSGLGINCDNHSFPAITRCVIAENVSGAASGGGLSCHIQSSPTIRDCTFVKNTAGAGGAIALANDSDPSIVNCRFEGNTAESGGAMICNDASPTVMDCVFLGNRSDDSGGALYCQYDSQPILLRCTFEDNRAGAIGNGVGGAIYVAHQSVVAGADCRFVGNSSLKKGGALYVWESRGVFQRSTFTDNSAVLSAGAAYIGPRFGATEFRSCTFYGNSAPLGAGVHLASPIENPASATFQNTIIAFGDSGEAVYRPENMIVQLQCCDIFGNAGGDYVGGIKGFLGANGNISEDPLFCDASIDDLTILITSPCAPENSPPGCELIGALPVGCGVTDVPDEAPSASLKLTVIPNPVRGVARFELRRAVPVSTLNIFDSQGRLVEQLSGKDGHWEWTPGSLPAGIYFVMPERKAVGVEPVKFLYLR
jgi:predicted outer membrane repeat protein